MARTSRIAAVFTDPDLFTSKGLADAALRYFGVAALGVTLNLCSAPPSVVVDNQRPFACVDLEQVGEYYARAQKPYPAALESDLDEFFFSAPGPIRLMQPPHSPLPLSLSVFPNAESGRRFAMEKGRRRVLCWFVDTPADPLLEEDEPAPARAPRDLLLSKWATPATSRIPVSVSAMIAAVEAYNLGGDPITLTRILQPRGGGGPGPGVSDPNAFALREASAERLADVLDTCPLNGDERQDAFRAVLAARWIVNPLRIMNTSRSATCSSIRVQISLEEIPDYLGGSLVGETFAGLLIRGESLLPSDVRWAFVRTKDGAISSEDVTVRTDRNPSIDPDLTTAVLLVVLALAALHLATNGVLLRSTPPSPRAVDAFAAVLAGLAMGLLDLGLGMVLPYGEAEEGWTRFVLQLLAAAGLLALLVQLYPHFSRFLRIRSEVVGSIAFFSLTYGAVCLLAWGALGQPFVALLVRAALFAPGVTTVFVLARRDLRPLLPPR